MQLTILVIEPDETHRRHLRNVLTTMGFGAKCFDALDVVPPDKGSAAYPAAVIDLDRSLPDQRLLRAWHAAHRAMRIIGMSRHRFDPERAEIIGRHLFACIKKPVDPEELGQLLRDTATE